ncbi:molybdopterin molybdotransferase MoeA [Sphingomonas sp. ID0503]|uniref:molybdopterin molybdotransferase MoeA n=1 Tax=Sphingomonas sp. ID0503 TaxID=3399691 RepID=UPI003AFB5787
MKHAPVTRCEQVPCAATLSFDAAQALLASVISPLGTESVLLAKAGGRVLAEPVRAAMDIPREDLAAMDGFAVRDADLAAGQKRFRVIGAAYPGAPYEKLIGRDEAVRIMTGAATPRGTDRVLLRELVTEIAGSIEIDEKPSGKPHVRPRGSDTLAGVEVLPAGRVLDPRALVVAAAADAARLTVWCRPRVRLIATGDELVPPGAASQGNGVPDSLSQAVLLMAQQWGGLAAGAALVRDDIALLTAAVAAATEDADLIVLTGGASRGDRDFAKSALAPLGLELLFADVAIKPGKPVWVGRIARTLVLGLPGNPTAAMTVARLFLAPLLTGLGGRGMAAGLRWERAPLIEDTDAGDRESFLCAERLNDGVRIIARQAASSQCMLARADALVRLPAARETLPAGTPVDLLRF